MKLKKALCVLTAAAMLLTTTPVFARDANVNVYQPQQNSGLAFLEGLMTDSDIDLTEPIPVETNDATLSGTVPPADWTICIYMCGSSLETKDGYATQDLLEMIQADIPENVRLLVMTGGAKTWNPKNAQNSLVKNNIIAADAYIQPSSSESQLFEIKGHKMTMIKDYTEYKNMGDKQTTAQFMSDCRYYAPSERTMLLFWDHGGGPIGGVALDEIKSDTLSLAELSTVLKSHTDAKNDKIDLLAFDASVMNNIETAWMLSPYADYMLGSEEIMPGEGLNYSWLNSMYKEYTDGDAVTALEAEELGRAIIDNYAYSFNKEGKWSEAKDNTLALVDMSQMEKLATAFDDMAFELANIATDDEKFTTISRIAEKVQHMYDYYGLLDLYDFANSISPYIESAKKVADALGTSPGTDPANYVGEVGGADPVIVYRGTGLSHDKCLGMAFYYPTTSTELGTLNEAQAKNAVSYYRSFGLSDFYTAYLMNIIIKVNDMRHFTGTMNVEYDSDISHYTLSIEDPEDAIAIKAVRYFNFFTDKTPGEKETTYLLGINQVTEDWENAEFSDRFDGNWYAMNDEIFSMDTIPYNDMWEAFSIPVVLEDFNVISTLKAYHMIPSEKYPDPYIYIDTITTPTKYLSEESMAALRSWRPGDDFNFRTLLRICDMDTQKIIGYKINEPVTFTQDSKYGLYYMQDKMKVLPLNSGQTALYSGSFAITDMQNKTTLSDPHQYIVLDYFTQLTADPIPSQVYTGKAIEPKVKLLFMGKEIFSEGTDYTVEYANNVEKGQASITITSLMTEDLPGVITLHFDIKDPGNIAEDKIAAIPDHLPGIEGETIEELLKHVACIEDAQLYLSSLTYDQLKTVSAAAKEKLAQQYNEMLKIYDLTTTDGNVEVVGVLDNLDWASYFNGIDQPDGAEPVASFDKAWLYAKSEEPASETEKQALTAATQLAQAVSAKATQIACYNTKFLAQNGNAEPDRVEFNTIDNKSILMKIKLASNIKQETLQIYRIAYGDPTPQAVNASIVENGSSTYAVFQTDSFGHYALFAEKASSSNSNNGGGGGSAATVDYKVTFDTQGGSSIDSVTVSKNSTLTKPQSPTKSGYSFDGWFTDKACTKAYDFSTKVTSGFTLYAKWTAISGSEGIDTSDTWNNPFTDVKSSDWFYGNVKYSFENKLFSGISDTLFAPNDPLTRAMLVTALYRAEGEPNIDNEILGYPFADVDAESWYGDPVYWARLNKIVSGYSDEEFAPDRLISRQEIATILMRYAAFKKIATVGSDNLSGFIDTVSISDWAKDSMQWAVGSKIIGGKADNILDPLSSATRAESAAMLQRLFDR